MEPMRKIIVAALAAASLFVAGCSMQVSEKREEGRKKEVEIKTPVGGLSVRTEVDARDTGLPVYPGSRPVRDDDDEPGSANVSIGTSFFGLKVIAAKFESDDGPEKVLDFYRKEMKGLGEVTECQGNVDFEGEKGAKKAVCKSGNKSETTLVVGDEERHRITVVKPRGSGAEFALVYISLRGEADTI
jgi:hypothetical protein